MDRKKGVHFGFNMREFSFVLDSGYIVFDVGDTPYGGMWWTWLGFEFAFCYELVDYMELLNGNEIQRR